MSTWSNTAILLVRTLTPVQSTERYGKKLSNDVFASFLHNWRKLNPSNLGLLASAHSRSTNRIPVDGLEPLFRIPSLVGHFTMSAPNGLCQTQLFIGKTRCQMDRTKSTRTWVLREPSPAIQYSPGIIQWLLSVQRLTVLYRMAPSNPEVRMPLRGMTLGGKFRIKYSR